jgi:hypothetical protein
MVPGDIMAVANVTARYEHAVNALAKSFQDMKRVNSAAAHGADYSNVGRIGHSAYARQVGASIATPIAQETEYAWFELICHVTLLLLVRKPLQAPLRMPF